jgi:hypothetical protein
LLKQHLAGDPALTVSRLVCPRRLDPSTEYLACVVPTFELGRKAGLGLPIESADEQALTLAWTLGAQFPAEGLPVYFHWEFRTGTRGDFESLVRSLVARDLSKIADVGKRPMDISQPGFGTTPPLSSLSSGTTLELEGALRVLTPPLPVHDQPAVDWPEVSRTPFQTALKDILESPWWAMKEQDKAPLLAPPIYGCWQAARHTVEISPSTSTPWLDELNLDPRRRAVAALGTMAVQTQQEQLMASAWQQLGEIRRINQMLRQAQLGRVVNAVYHSRDFTRFSEETLLKVVAPAQSRVVVEAADNTRALLAQRISKSAIPNRAISAPLRRFTSPRGVISTRFRADRALPITIVAKLNTTSFVPLQKKEAGLVTINEVSDDPSGAFAGPLKQTVRFENVGNALEVTPPLGDFNIASEGAPMRTLLDFTPGLPADSADAQAFRNAAKEHYAYLQKAFLSSVTFPAVVRMNLVDIKAQLLESVNPQKTINARLQRLVLAGGTESRADPLEPILDAPDFPQPMYEALRDLSQDFLFPGLEHVLPNTVALLETNPKFIESFLVGLNVEMSRELLWRDYPTDQRGTYFRQFWETLSDDDDRDIDAIVEWGDRKLGDNVHTGEKVVLLIRGELLRRYPNSVIYAVKAEKSGEQLDLSPGSADERHPRFRGTLRPDVTFLGFDLTDTEALGEPPYDPSGWFFVIQEQPTEPRFGLDAAEFDKPVPELETWNDLNWRHLVKTEEELNALSHASIKTVLPVIAKVEWGKNSAHQAYITLQRPVRIGIHARQMIPPK